MNIGIITNEKNYTHKTYNAVLYKTINHCKKYTTNRVKKNTCVQNSFLSAQRKYL